MSERSAALPGSAAPSPLVRSRVSRSAVARKVGCSPSACSIRGARVRAFCPGARIRSASGYGAGLDDLGASNSSWPSEYRGSTNKREPTCSGVPGLSATQSECPRRSRAPSSTQFGGDRHSKPPWISLTRKRSLVQIQYGPRDFSKSCLALRAKMGARLLRFCAISAGHGAGIPASTQGVPAVSVSSKPIAADAIECGNHAASRTSRTVNAARHAHTPTRRSRSVWVQHPCMASISAIPARSRSQLGRV